MKRYKLLSEATDTTNDLCGILGTKGILAVVQNPLVDKNPLVREPTQGRTVQHTAQRVPSDVSVPTDKYNLLQ